LTPTMMSVLSRTHFESRSRSGQPTFATTFASDQVV
jgi:hypothetical protein